MNYTFVLAHVAAVALASLSFGDVKGAQLSDLFYCDAVLQQHKKNGCL